MPILVKLLFREHFAKSTHKLHTHTHTHIQQQACRRNDYPVTKPCGLYGLVDTWSCFLAVKVHQDVKNKNFQPLLATTLTQWSRKGHGAAQMTKSFGWSKIKLRPWIFPERKNILICGFFCLLAPCLVLIYFGHFFKFLWISGSIMGSIEWYLTNIMSMYNIMYGHFLPFASLGSLEV